jgi:hypothetical protein
MSKIILEHNIGHEMGKMSEKLVFALPRSFTSHIKQVVDSWNEVECRREGGSDEGRNKTSSGSFSYHERKILLSKEM